MEDVTSLLPRQLSGPLLSSNGISPPMGSSMGKLGPCGVAGRWPRVSSGASTAVEWLRVASSDELGAVEDKHGEDEEARSVHNV
jgi:hypothetical protein